MTSRPGKTLHLLRTVSSNPQALAVVVRSSAARPVRILWWSYCAINDDDAMDETHQQTARGVGAVITYPPVLSGATFCYVSVVVTPPPRARAVAAVFSY